MTTPDIESLEQHLAANPRLRQEFVFGSMVGGMARANSTLDLAVDAGWALTADLATFCELPVAHCVPDTDFVLDGPL